MDRIPRDARESKVLQDSNMELMSLEPDFNPNLTETNNTTRGNATHHPNNSRELTCWDAGM